MNRHPLSKRTAPAPSQQRGIVLIFALITLVILLIGGVAISRSISGAQFTVGNIGFKRDLANQGERALLKVMEEMRGTGALASVTTRNTDLKAANYKATLLPTNGQGIPTALLSNTEFDSVGVATNDITVSDTLKVRYVIDRVATINGTCGPNTCAMANQIVFGGGSSEWINSQTNSGSANNPNPSAVPLQPVYRLTLKVTGPRKTLSFFQSTFTIN